MQGVNLLDILEANFNIDSDNRTYREDGLSTICQDGEPGDVLIYCPEKDMALKEAEMLIDWKQSFMPLSKVEDKLLSRKIGSILGSHEQLWSLKIFILPELKKKMEKRPSDATLLNSWCDFLVREDIVGSQHHKQTAYLLILQDILTSKKAATSEILEEIQQQLLKPSEQRVRGGANDLIHRKDFEKLIDDLLLKKKKSENEGK